MPSCRSGWVGDSRPSCGQSPSGSPTQAPRARTSGSRHCATNGRVPMGVRIDGGLLGSPVGLANLTVRRPHLNPTISQPASLFSPLPAVEVRGPRGNLLGAIYPFGGQVTVSGARWDARAAVIDTSPASTARHLRRSEASPIYQCRRRWRCHAIHRFPNRCLGDPRRLDARWREPHQHG